MKRAFQISSIANDGTRTVWCCNRYFINGRMNAAALDDFITQLAQQAGVRFEQVTILNIFELEGDE